MGKRSFFRDEEVKRKRRERRAANGYVPKAHQEEDALRKRHDRTDETREQQQEYVTHYLEFVTEEDYEPAGYQIEPGCPAPDIVVVKDFIRSYVRTVRGTGRLSKDGLATVRTALSCAERFFGGFEEATGSKIVEDDRAEIYSWIKKTLTAEGEIEDIKKQKFNFTRHDFTDLVSSMWTRDSPVFLHGLLKVFILFALQVFLFTGARIGAFIPDAKYRSQRGLRYKHIELVLFRSPNRNEPWKIGWRINQQWLKKNRNPNYTVFGIGIRDDNRPQFASGILLLVIALAHEALHNINSLNDLAEFDLRDGPTTEVPLSWKPDALNKPVFRNVTAEGPQEVPLNKERFCSFLRLLIIAAGYSKNATIHDIRRELGKKIEARHGSAPVSQIYAHRSESTYPEHYQAHCSSIDTVGDVLDAEEETYHIAYFQGYRQFREIGLPSELPAKMKEAILGRPELVEARNRIQELVTKADLAAAGFEKYEYRKLHTRIRLSELYRYQAEWFQETRDRRVLNRGKNDPERPESNTCTHALALIMPELDRLAVTLSSTEPLSFDARLLFAEQLLTQCRRDYDVIYLRNEAPADDGRCPVHDCRADIQILERRKRSPHIHDCVRRDVAQRLHVNESDLRYCYECMTWCPKTEWRDHCACHLQSWSDRHCEVIVYRYTIIRPGYCPCCLWNQELPADDRLKYWLCSAGMRKHIEKKHIEKVEWPTNGPICGCSQSFESERDFRYHLHDVHGLADGIWKLRKPTSKRKRAAKTEPACLDEKAQEPKPKKTRFRHYQPPHQHLQTADSHERSTTIQTQAPDQTQASVTFWEYPCPPSYSSSDATGRSASESSTADTSAPTSALSSLRTTPDLELIDPRILDPVWFGSGEPPDASAPAACAEDGVKSKVHERMADARTISHLDALHIDDHQLEREGSEIIADTSSKDLSAPSNDVRLCSRDEDPKDALPDRCIPECSGHKPLFTNNLCGTPYESTGPVTRARTKAEHTVDIENRQGVSKMPGRLTPAERRTLQALKDQNLTWSQIKSRFPKKPVGSLRHAWKIMQQPSTQRQTRSQAKNSNLRGHFS